jgi:hypothetical protein
MPERVAQAGVPQKAEAAAGGRSPARRLSASPVRSGKRLPALQQSVGNQTLQGLAMTRESSARTTEQASGWRPIAGPSGDAMSIASVAPGVVQRQAAPPAKPTQPERGAWDDLPAAAQKVLQHSFDALNKEECKKKERPMWCFDSAADAFNNLDRERQSAFRSVYSALVSSYLWDSVETVVSIQAGANPQIEGFSKSSAELVEKLHGNPHFCRDTGLGGRLHPHETMWREVVTGAQGLHVGFGTNNRMTAHLDSTAPVAAREDNGFCRYSMPDLLPHWSKDVKGWRDIELFPRPTEEPKPGDVQPWIRFRIPGT